VDCEIELIPRTFAGLGKCDPYSFAKRLQALLPSWLTMSVPMDVVGMNGSEAKPAFAGVLPVQLLEHPVRKDSPAHPSFFVGDPQCLLARLS
jgi:hypothetical protein